jgi:two-component system sensor histidine kinase KdpD
LDAPWIALNVDDGKVLDAEDSETLHKNLALARDLGAEVITTSGTDIAQAIQRIARQKSVTQIIVGRSPSIWFSNFFQRNSLLDRLAKECSDIDLHVIRQTLMPKRKRKGIRIAPLQISSYILTLLFVSVLTLINWFLLPYLGYKVSGFIFLLGILVLSLFFRKGPILLASGLYALIWTFVFIPLAGKSFEFEEDITLLIFYFLTAVVVGVLTDRAKRHKEMLIKRERSIEALYEIVREIATSASFHQVVMSIRDRLGSVLNGKCEILLKQIDNGIVIDESVSFSDNEKEKAAANWVFQNGKEAGWSTSTLPYAQNLYVPLVGRKEVVGILVYHPAENKELSVEEKNFIYSISHQLASYFERHMSEEKGRKLEHLKQIEKNYHSILLLISSLFEGPLLTIQDAVKTLKKSEESVPASGSETPLEQILIATENLTRILENITAMVNLQAGLTPVNLVKQKIQDLVTTSMETVKLSAPIYKWSLKIEEDLPEVSIDYELMELLFYNLVFHAIEFSPPDSTIEVKLYRSADHVIFSVSGEGQSIPPEIVDVAFEKFYRIPGTTTSGLGLGLAVAKAIAEIHNGQLKVENRSGGGMVFSLYLPIEY